MTPGWVTALGAAVWLGAAQLTLPSGWRTLDRGHQSDIAEARRVVVRTAGEWAALWKDHAAARTPPDVNFEREIVVGVFLGTRPTAGYGVEVVAADARAGALIVRFRESGPAPGTLTAQILTAPYHLVAAPAWSGAVEFERVP